MSAVEAAIEKVKDLDEESARALLQWLQLRTSASNHKAKALGPRAMLGYARRFQTEPRTTESWMKELREGEK